MPILCVTGWFPIYGKDGRDTGNKEFIVSHGVDLDTDKTVILSSEHPSKLGAVMDADMQEWVIPDPELNANPNQSSRRSSGIRPR